MILPTFLKRRTSRRTSKRRQKLSKTKPKYDSLEPRNLLATFVVSTTADVVDADDGLLSLREAVTAANSNEAFSDAPAGDVDGDWIILPGRHGELTNYVLTQGELAVTDDLVVRGSGIGNGGSTVRGGGATSIFNVATSERVRFQALHLVGGSAERPGGILSIGALGDVVVRDSMLNSGNAIAGGAINVVDSRLFVRSTQFSNHIAENGGAIHATGSDVRIVSSEFLGNRSNGDGGAIYATGGMLGVFESDFGSNNGENTAANSGGAIFIAGTPDDEGIFVSSSSFYNNAAESGGAIFAGENTSAFIVSGQLHNNGTENAEFSVGGAIYSEGNGLYLTDVSLVDNRATQGGAVYSEATYSNFRDLDVNGNVSSTFGSGNESVASGGGLLFIGLEAYVSDSTVSGNEAGGVAGGIAVSGSKLVLRRVIVAGNSSVNGGGGIWASPESTLRVFGSAVTDNFADNMGGGLAAIDSDVLITGSTVSDNSVRGGTVLGGPTSGASSSGGGIAVTGGSTLIFDSSISDNESGGIAGGLLVRDGFARLQDTVLHSNTARNVGGAIDARSSTLVLVGGEVSFNEVTDEVFGSRAGAVNVGADARMFVRGGTRFESNAAQGFGGAIQSAGVLGVQDAEFVANSAGRGGAISQLGGHAQFERTQFLRNRAEVDGAAIFARVEFFGSQVLILSDTTITENEVTDSENGHPVFLNGSVFLRDTLGSNFDNTPNNGIRRI